MSATDKLRRLASAGLGSGLAALVALAAAYAVLIEAPGANQMSHYALVRALSSGTATIDRWQAETLDKAYYKGHFYSVKAPALGALTTPPYKALDATGLTGVARRAAAKLAETNQAPTAAGPAAQVRAARGVVWALGLFGTVLPALLLLVLVRRLAEDLEPGLGTAVAVLLGLGTLILPFAALFYAHVLSAVLGFAAFALLWRGRPAHVSTRTLVAAGALAGLAVVAEYPFALAALILAAYALVRAGTVRRWLAYAGGLVGGLIPLAAYNLWAFGSIAHLSYKGAVAVPGTSGHERLGLNDPGLFGIEVPTPHALLELLFSARGLLILSPLLALAIAGVVLIYQRGLKAEALTIAGLAAVFVLYDAGYYTPFGGETPGPRFLIPAVPFLALGLAPMLRRFPLTSVALGSASALVLAIATVTRPQIGGDDTGEWVRLLRGGDFQYTVASAVGAGHGWVALAPFVLAVVAAVWFTVRATPTLQHSRVDTRLALVALAAWAMATALLPALIRSAGGPRDAAAAMVLLGAGVVAGLIALVWMVAANRAR